MTKVQPFHTNSDEYEADEKRRYHDSDECGHGKLIQQRHREPGRNGRIRCKRCDDLDTTAQQSS